MKCINFSKLSVNVVNNAIIPSGETHVENNIQSNLDSDTIINVNPDNNNDNAGLINFGIQNLNTVSGTSDSSSESVSETDEGKIFVLLVKDIPNFLRPSMFPRFPFRRDNITNINRSIENFEQERNLFRIPPINDYIIENSYFDNFYNTDNITRPQRRDNNTNLNFDFQDFDHQKILLQNHQKKKFGKLAVNFFHKLLKNKLIKYTQMNIYTIKKIYKTYFSNFKIENSKENNSFKLTRKFFNCLLPINHLEKYINSINFQDKEYRNDIFFIKVFMGVYQHFYLEFDFPLFDNYLKKFLKLAIKFHESLTEDNLAYIEEKLAIFSYDLESSLHFGMGKNIATFFQKKQECIDHYTSEIKRITNLTNGINKSDFVV